MKKFVLLAALGALALAACTKIIDLGPKPEVPVESITLDKEVLFVPLDGQLTLHAVAVPEEAGPIVWISNDPSVATVSKEGVVKGIDLGEADIIAVAGKLLASCHVTVVTPINEITLNNSSAKIEVSNTLQLEAVISPAEANEPIEWSSDNPEIATVDEDGLITAVAVGKATVTAKSNYAEAKCEVEIIPIQVTSITLDPRSATIGIGESVEFTATILPENAEDQTVVWSVEDEGIVTIEDGVVTAVATTPSYTYIRATSANGVYARAFVGVNAPASVPYFEDFEDIEALFQWRVYDIDGDGYKWYYFQESGINAIISYSYSSGALTPDNWTTSPLIKLDENYNELSFWVCPYSSSYPYETYAAYIILPDENGEVTEEGLNSAVGLVKGTLRQGYNILYDETAPAVEPTSSEGWEQVGVVIPSEYNGKEVSIAFRHFDCTDQFALILDEVEINNVKIVEGMAKSTTSAPGFHNRNMGNIPGLRPFGSKIF